MHEVLFKMAEKDDFLVGSDLEAVLDLIEEDLFNEDEEFSTYFNDIVKSNEEASLEKKFGCTLCEKICKSKQGLSRHMNCKHKDVPKDNDATPVCKEPKIDLSTFHGYIKKACDKIILEEIYSPETMASFKEFDISLEDAGYIYSIFKQPI